METSKYCAISTSFERVGSHSPLSHRLSREDGTFTALTCGDVTVTARARGSEAADRIELRIVAPEGYSEASGKGYSLVYPAGWTRTVQGGVIMWMASDGATNLNVTTEPLNNAYFTTEEKVLAASMQTLLETTYSLLNATVTFSQPMTVRKETYLGIQRIQTDCRYGITVNGVKSSAVHQTQYIFNNEGAGLSCILTITFPGSDYDERAKAIEKTVASQFMPD